MIIIKKIEAIAIDLDGTLLNSNHEISNFNKKIIFKLIDMGIKVIIATGRPYPSLYKYKEELKLKTPVISYNGACVYNAETDEKILEIPLEEEITKELIKIARKNDIHLNLFKDDKWFIEKLREEVETYRNISNLEYNIKDFDEFENYFVTKAMFVGKNDVLKKIEKRIDEKFGNKIYKAFSRSFFLEILNKEVSKGDTLLRALEKEKINPENVIAFGDRYNDYEMLKKVGIGVVMENAPEDLKSEFKYIAKSNDEDGVGVFLKEFFNI